MPIFLSSGDHTDTDSGLFAVRALLVSSAADAACGLSEVRQSLLEQAAPEAEAQGFEMSEFYRPHRPAVAASRAGASNAGEAAPAMPPPVGRSLQTHGGPLAYSAKQLAEALGYVAAVSVYQLAKAKDQK